MQLAVLAEPRLVPLRTALAGIGVGLGRIVDGCPASCPLGVSESDRSCPSPNEQGANYLPRSISEYRC